MAKFLPIHGFLSGKLAGNVYSHNAAGPYVKGLSVPVNPNTSRQNLVRGFFGDASNDYSAVLTVAQRIAWTAYGKTVQLAGSLGRAFGLSGINAYVRTRAFRDNAGASQLNDAPITFGEAPSIFTRPGGLVVTDAASGAASSILLTFADIEGFDETTDQTWISMSMSDILSPGIAFFNGPWKFKGAFEGDTAAPPTTGTASSGLVLAVGDLVAVRLRWCDQLGRVSPQFQQFVNVTNVP